MSILRGPKMRKRRKSGDRLIVHEFDWATEAMMCRTAFDWRFPAAILGLVALAFAAACWSAFCV